KCQITILEVECNILKTMVINFEQGRSNMGFKSSAINQLQLQGVEGRRIKALINGRHGNCQVKLRPNQCNYRKSWQSSYFLLSFMFCKMIKILGLFPIIYTIKK